MPPPLHAYSALLELRSSMLPCRHTYSAPPRAPCLHVYTPSARFQSSIRIRLRRYTCRSPPDIRSSIPPRLRDATRSARLQTSRARYLHVATPPAHLPCLHVYTPTARLRSSRAPYLHTSTSIRFDRKAPELQTYMRPR